MAKDKKIDSEIIIKRKVFKISNKPNKNIINMSPKLKRPNLDNVINQKKVKSAVVVYENFSPATKITELLLEDLGVLFSEDDIFIASNDYKNMEKPLDFDFKMRLMQENINDKIKVSMKPINDVKKLLHIVEGYDEIKILVSNENLMYEHLDNYLSNLYNTNDESVGFKKIEIIAYENNARQLLNHIRGNDMEFVKENVSSYSWNVIESIKTYVK